MIADDHSMFRQGLSLLLRSTPGYELMGEAATGPQALEIITESKPDVAVLDISMPGFGGLDVFRKIVRQGLATKVVLVTIHTDPELAQEALDEGVSGYLLKENAFEDLLAAIRAVMGGGTFISPLLAASLMRARNRDGREKLTRREWEILSWVAAGLTNKKIARNLFISVRTVETHRSRIMEKLGMNSTAELIRYAIEKGIGKPG
jgi:two-component system response regulator NreC